MDYNIKNIIKKDLDELLLRKNESYEKLLNNNIYIQQKNIEQSIKIKYNHFKMLAKIDSKYKGNRENAEEEYNNYISSQREFLQKYLPYGENKRNIIDVDRFDMEKDYNYITNLLNVEMDYIVYQNLCSEYKLLEEFYNILN